MPCFGNFLVSPDDFAPYNMTVIFEECTTSLCVYITINDDSTLEEEEEFDVLVGSKASVTLIHNTTVVYIMDNEGTSH